MIQLVAVLTAILLSVTGIAAQPSTIILVRHAEKASSGGADPALSAIGAQRARDLATAIRDANIRAVIVTQYKRTSQTAAQVLAAAGLEPQVVMASRDIAAHADSVAAAVRAQPAASTVLVVGHSNTISAIIAALDGPAGPDICDSQYGNLFIITNASSDSPGFIHAHYGAADPPPGDECSRGMLQN